jgi:hypothetical protein
VTKSTPSHHIRFHLIDVFPMLSMHDINLLAIEPLLVFKNEQRKLTLTSW